MPLPNLLSLDEEASKSPESSKSLCNRYKIVDTIGVGSYGTVSRVHDSISGSIRALKCIKIPDGEHEKEWVDALQEAKLLATLSHPHVVKLTDAFQEQTAFYIVMEYCANGALDECINGARESATAFPEEQICCWINQLGFALEYIHSKRILHRDLKTKNIFLSVPQIEGDEPWPDLKIGDFGISRTLFESADLASTCIGTPYYFSPEVFKQTGYNHKADMWAIGCILYELSTLSHPFTPAENLAQLMHRVVTKEPSYSGWTSPQSARALCQELLCKSPMKRPDAKEMLANTWLRAHQRDFKQRHLPCISLR